MAAPAAAHSMWTPITASLVDMLLSESIRMFSIRLFAAVHGPAMYSSLVSVLCPVRCQFLAALCSAMLGDCRHHRMWGGATSCSSVDVGSLGLFVVIVPCAARAQGCFSHTPCCYSSKEVRVVIVQLLGCWCCAHLHSMWCSAVLLCACCWSWLHVALCGVGCMQCIVWITWLCEGNYVSAMRCNARWVTGKTNVVLLLCDQECAHTQMQPTQGMRNCSHG